jgi:KGK domain
MTKNIPDFNSEDVISFGNFTIKCKDLQRVIESISENEHFAQIFHSQLKNKSVNISDKVQGKWGQGIECETLRPGDPAWRNGKIKLCLSLEFTPDEPEEEMESIESPLDEIRQMLDDN